MPLLYTIVQNHFKTIENLKKDYDQEQQQKFRSSIVPRILVNSLIEDLSQNPNVFKPESALKLNFRSTASLVTKMLSQKKKILTRKNRMVIRESKEFKEKMAEYEKKSMMLAPTIEGRIIAIQNEDVSECK